jgi:hypothetical protein
VKEEPNVCPPSFGAFPSDRIRKATKDVRNCVCVCVCYVTMLYVSEILWRPC